MEAHEKNPQNPNDSNELREKLNNIFRQALVKDTNQRLQAKGSKKRLNLDNNNYTKKISIGE